MEKNKNLQLKKKIFGGVDELDVLKKFKELNSAYKQLVLNQQKNYEEKIKSLEFEIDELKKQIS